MLKKILAIILSITLALSLFACGNSTSSSASNEGGFGSLFGQSDSSSAPKTNSKTSDSKKEEKKDTEEESKNNKKDSNEKSNTKNDDVKKTDDKKEESKDTNKSDNSSYEVIDEVKLGHLENGDAIEWLILKKDGNRAFLLSKYVLANHPYHDKDEEITWEGAEVRKWLNSEFINQVFTEDEQKAIETTTVKTKDNEKPKEFNKNGKATKGGKETKDKLFLLSIEEAEKISQDIRKTTYDNLGSVRYSRTSKASWLLRTPGDKQDCVSNVGTKGEIDWGGYTVNSETYGGAYSCSVRPAMWIDLKTLDKADGSYEKQVSESLAAIKSLNVKLLPKYDENTRIDDMETVTFGSYMQADDGSKSPIEWFVIAEEDNNAFLISKYILDCKPYNDENKEVTWEDSTIRKWLNLYFYDTAFNSSEKDAILKTQNLDNNNADMRDEVKEPATNDKIFLFGLPEAKKYFKWQYTYSVNQLMTKGTDYAKNVDCDGKNLWQDTSKNEWYFGYSPYWFRTPGSKLDRAVYMLAYGTLLASGEKVNDADYKYGVRPCMWVSIDKFEKVDKSGGSSYVAKKEEAKFDEEETTKKSTSKLEEKETEKNSTASSDDTKDTSSEKKKFSGWDGDSYYKDGKKIIKDWVEEDNKWYYLKGNGKYAKSEWVEIKGEYYYFDDKGAMVSSQWVENKYYVGSDGKMYRNKTTPDGYFVGADGSYVPQNTAAQTQAVANIAAQAVANTTTNSANAATNVQSDATGIKSSSNTKVKTYGKYNEGLVKLYNTVKEGKGKEYKEAKFDNSGKLWMFRPISDIEHGLMIYTAVDKKTYYFCNEDIPMYAKDGQTIKDEEGEEIFNTYYDMDDEYEIDADNAEE